MFHSSFKRMGELYSGKAVLGSHVTDSFTLIIFPSSRQQHADDIHRFEDTLRTHSVYIAGRIDVRQGESCSKEEGLCLPLFETLQWDKVKRMGYWGIGLERRILLANWDWKIFMDPLMAKMSIEDF